MLIREFAKKLIRDDTKFRAIKKILGLISPVVGLIVIKEKIERQSIDNLKPYLIVVSHDASTTGAPILALNICKRLSNEFNIITIVLRNGKLIKSFEEVSGGIIYPRFGIMTRGMVKQKIKNICEKVKPQYAIVNSAVSACTIKPIRSNGVPVLSLIHEFSAYIRPVEIIEHIASWSDTIIFSSTMTRDDIIESCPIISKSNIKVLPQGRCDSYKLKEKTNRKSNKIEEDKCSHFIDSLDPETILVIGAGVIQPRKGVDLFVAVAAKIKKENLKKKIKFAWVGAGYDPINDFNVSLWVKDQIKKSGLEEDIEMLDQTASYERLMERANFFLMTSRLDPLPNVSIDAMYASTPMLCFQKGCGIGSLMSKDKILNEYLIVKYLDVNEMAAKVLRLIEDNGKYYQTGKRCKDMANKWFNMENYISELKKCGQEAIARNEKLNDNSRYLMNSVKMDKQNFFRYQNQRKGSKDIINNYLISWQNQVWARKPEPGFHPGIYKDAIMQMSDFEDPYVDYLRKGRPKGKWKSKVLKNNNKAEIAHNSNKIALHIHVHYVELFEEIVKALKYNQVNPDIFISFNDQEKKGYLKSYCETRGLKIKKITQVPNTGRDIGPMLTEFGKILDKEYDIYGHIHTKASRLINDRVAKNWRQYLIGNLLGYKGYPMADNIIYEMTKDSKLGLVFPDDPTCTGWTNNYLKAKELASRLRIYNLPRSIDFPVGTMFWARKGALKKLIDLDLEWSDYPAEPIDYDGTLLHAIERLIPIITNESGFDYGVTSLETLKR